MRLSDITEAFKNATPEERQEFIKQIIPDLEDKITIIIEKVLLTSELKPIKRIAELETITGLNDFSDFEEEEEDREPTIPEKISRLEEITAQLNKAETSLSIDKSNIPPSKNITEIRADYLAEYIMKDTLIPTVPSFFANCEIKVIDSKEFRYFVDHVLPEEYRPESTRNLRKMKKDVYDTAVKRHGSKIAVDKADHGRQELRLIYLNEKTVQSQPALTATV